MIFSAKDRAKLDWIQAEMVRNAGEYVRRCKLNDERWEAVEQSQGKLLAALNQLERDVEQGALGTYEKLTALGDEIGKQAQYTERLYHAVSRQPRRQGKRKRGR